MRSLVPGQPVPHALREAEVVDGSGAPSTLGERWAGGPALVVFLRHFGCIGCADHVTELAPRLHEMAAVGVHIVFIGNGEHHYIEGFVERHGLGDKQVEIVTDPSRRAFEAAGLVRSAWATYGPRALYHGLRTRLLGHANLATEGDDLQQAGVVLVDRHGCVAFVHRDRSLGDHPPTVEVVAAVLRVAGQGRRIA